ncbi:hypothetical protein SDC9_164003 [bioreactor metagenome]|uniref:Uncharacterized protein n=1 Tax=bioreactor metagenome TaxID=1076179 RepID=A0A645FQE8_9ZZZZ
MMLQRGDFQRVVPFQILEQLFLLLRSVLLPPLGRLRALHHPRGLRADEPAIRRVLTDLAALYAIRPFGGSPRRGMQLANLACKPFVLPALKIVLSPAVLFPTGKVALLQLNTRAVDREDVIYAAIQKRAVVTD